MALVLPGLAARLVLGAPDGLLVDGLLIDELPLLAPPVDMFELAAGPCVSLAFCAAGDRHVRDQDGRGQESRYSFHPISSG